MHGPLERDFDRFGREWRADVVDHIRQTYRIDLTTSYLGRTLPHPIGKGSGQLSLRADQLEADAAAGLAFVVLKTVIAQDERGGQSMAAWAVHETRMKVERIRSLTGREGWTVTWKGRGWDRSLDEYLALVRAGRDLTRAGGPLVVPSVKYHLPAAGEPFRDEEYRFTTGQLAQTWGKEALLLEKDFSPTLAGDALADERSQVLRWVREVPGRIRSGAPHGLVLGLKLMNARFDDAFQREMIDAARGSGADALVVFNRLFDPVKRVAFGGWDLSDRNLRVLARTGPQGGRGRSLPLSGTGNVHSGRLILDYARAGCATVQLHTYFQVPLGEYPARHGSRTARVLHKLLFDPEDGLVAGMLDLEARGGLARVGGELRFRDLIDGALPGGTIAAARST
ncbi:MAG: hypothetical protein AB7I33_16425 [Gemmatimonadales bacterium]